MASHRVRTAAHRSRGVRGRGVSCVAVVGTGGEACRPFVHPTQSFAASFLAVLPPTLVLQQPGPGCDEGTCTGLRGGRVPLRDVNRPGPSLVPFAPRANILASSASVSLISALHASLLIDSADSVSLNILVIFPFPSRPPHTGSAGPDEGINSYERES